MEKQEDPNSAIKSQFEEVWGWVTSLSGSLLFLTLFMPAVPACNTPIYPFEIYWVYPPYLFGVVCLLWGLSKITPMLARYAKGINLLSAAYTAIMGLLWGAKIHNELLLTREPSDSLAQGAQTVELMFLLALLTWWLSAILFFRGAGKREARRRDPQRAGGRAIWVGALLCLSFFTPFMSAPHYYGLNLSFFASLTILSAGLINEFFPPDLFGETKRV